MSSPSLPRSRATWLLGQHYNGDERRTLVLLAGTLALASGNAATIGAVAPQVRQAFGVDNTAIGVLASASTAAAALATVPLGILVDRSARTRLLAISAGLMGVVSVLSAVAPSFAFLFVTRLALGALSGVAGPGVASLIGDTFHESGRGRSYAAVLAGELIGAGAGFGVAGELASVNWRASFAALAPPALVLSFYLHRLREPARGRTAASVGGQPRDDVVESWRQLSLARTVKYVLSVPTNVIFIFSAACTYFYFSGLRTFGVEYATEQYKVSQAVATAMFLLVGTGGLAGVLVSGRLGDRLEARYASGRVLVAMVALFGAAAAFVPAILIQSYAIGLPLMMAGAFGLAAATPPLSAGRLQVMPSGLWGRAEGVQGILRQVGDTMGPFAFGFAGDHLAGGGRAGLQSSFLIMLGSLVTAAAVLVLALRTYPHDVEAAHAALRQPPPVV
ncbi:MAG TPA: MFS transporter [Acidimicrobiales bacterium]|nr:MFS transporter [Acidimicrobiales bacterium]